MAALQGTLTQQSDAATGVTLQVKAALSGGAAGTFQLILHGTPAGNGAVTVTSSQAPGSWRRTVPPGAVGRASQGGCALLDRRRCTDWRPDANAVSRTYRAFLGSRAARPLRFVCTGGLAALVQLAILDALIDGRWAAIPANAVALLVSTQVNFVLSYLFTWRDRRPIAGTRLAVLRRWATYQGSVFVAAWADLHALVASALGTAVAALVNFVAGDRLVFRARSASS